MCSGAIGEGSELTLRESQKVAENLMLSYSLAAIYRKDARYHKDARVRGLLERREEEKGDSLIFQERASAEQRNTLLISLLFLPRLSVRSTNRLPLSSHGEPRETFREILPRRFMSR